MSLAVAIQMDPIQSINIDADSSFVLGLEALERGHSLFHYLPRDLFLRDGRVFATARALQLKRELGNHFKLGAPEVLDLAALDVILMRQDPPFDMAYITATHLLEHVQPTTLVVNDPVHVRNAPEKLYVTHFHELMPPTLIASDPQQIRAFRDEHKDIIVKPLFGNGGAGVFHIAPGDENLNALHRAVHPALPRTDHRPALSPGGAPGRQADHPDRRRGGGCHQPRSAQGRGALQYACRRPARARQS